ncbi:Na+/H+ antiporter subunit D [Thermoflexus hugenholtzii]|uniref:Multisubunit sodium/proton antiporter, MrpD subunit n=1 Tax=Thermoflexus hugenholtzii JAD2 TaxID=877466 RepID=A0A212QSC2_9CHLR|nr:Na+/H+ antiporter subunit D [Thermoflexus hugenholtzii]SNB62507.1 multisubunit sodium/proton antiporter, MrpD subunit [Thermoflexus hugenholtzii JAD2]
MGLWLILPILIPFLSAVATLLAWGQRPFQRAMGVLGTAGLLGAGVMLLDSVWRDGVQTLQVGNWPAPFGITLYADLFSAAMVILAGLIGLAVAVYSLGSMDPDREQFGYYAIFHILLMGVCGAFLTGDIFNLYVWFEVMLIASFVLMVLGGERAQLEGGIKYVTLNLMASALFLAAVGILYGVTGTLNMADLAHRLGRVSSPGLMTALALMFLVAFGIKAAVFPLFFWLPASYHTPPVAVSALFSGLLTKVGVYALIRVFTRLFVQDVGYTHTLILIIAGLTMVTGVLGAVAQMEVRRILSFHIISQIGYMVMGLGMLTPLALGGAIFYIIHHIIVKTNLFLISGMVLHLRGTHQLKNLGGLYRAHPGVSFLFLIPALSLAGLPPLSGFFAKLALVRAGLEAGQFAIVAVALGVSLLTLFSMMKIWNEAFWKPSGEDDPPPTRSVPTALWLPTAGLALLTILIGLAAGPLLVFSMRAAEQLLGM